jgi:hypothetical protein
MALQAPRWLIQSGMNEAPMMLSWEKCLALLGFMTTLGYWGSAASVPAQANLLLQSEKVVKSPVNPGWTASLSAKQKITPTTTPYSLEKYPWELSSSSLPLAGLASARVADGLTPVDPTSQLTVLPTPFPSGETFYGEDIRLGQATDTSPATPDSAPPAEASEIPSLDLDPEVIENSPVLQDWLQEIPDISDEIRNEPSFRTRLRLGYAQFPSNGQISGFSAGVEDVFLIPGAGLTASGDYYRSWNGQRESYGAEARYYLLPLGGYVNIAPTIGYRSLETPQYQVDGMNVGFRFMFIPSRGGAADISVSQQWVSPGGTDEVGLTSLSVGYAVTQQLRLSTAIQFQNSQFGQDSYLGLNLEWLL